MSPENLNLMAKEEEEEISSPVHGTLNLVEKEEEEEISLPVDDYKRNKMKASAYAEVVTKLNHARELALPFQPATAFRDAYESLDLHEGGKSVTVQKIWHLIQTLVGEDSSVNHDVSRKQSLVIGARRHLERGHEKYILDTIQSHPAQAALGEVVGDLQTIRAFLRIHLREYGVLDFDAKDACKQTPVDTTWEQIYFCLRTGYYGEALNVAMSSHVSHQFAAQLDEWICTGGVVSQETAAAATEECEIILMGNQIGLSEHAKKKLLLYAIISGSCKHIDWLSKDLRTIFDKVEDFLWFKLLLVRDCSGGEAASPSVMLNEVTVPYSLEDLQAYLNKIEPLHYTKNGKYPLVYAYVLFLSIQLLPAILYLSKETGDGGFTMDAVHISIVLADHGVLSDGAGNDPKLGLMDAFAEAASIIRQYGSVYLHSDNLSAALEYYAQAAAAMGGGELSWTGGNSNQQRQRQLMLKQLLTEMLLCDGGIFLLLGAGGAGEEGQLRRFLNDKTAQQELLLEAVARCQEAGLHGKVNLCLISLCWKFFFVC
ncbi:hypothetical protein MKW92_053943 [Papaver armeniacum]|nr:hypothetical protein MKW92_053943 [Papaver armeniacum]